jgi:hypothetical protein
LGDEVLLGALPMEDMDLVVSPGRREITVDPSSPNIPHARVKATGHPGDAPATIGGQAIPEAGIMLMNILRKSRCV